MAANGEKRYKAQQLANETTNLRRVTVIIGRSHVHLTQIPSGDDQLRRIRNIMTCWRLLQYRDGSLDMVRCMLHVTYCKLRVECRRVNLAGKQRRGKTVNLSLSIQGYWSIISGNTCQTGIHF